MKPLSKEYTLLFNAITEAEKSLMEVHQQLIEVQQEAEDLYISESVKEASGETVSA